MREDYEAFLMGCDQRQLEAMLVVMEAKLGTAAEQPGDFERVAAIAHRLNNLVTTLRICEQLRQLGAGDLPAAD